ncbi:hypothetical protein THAOC_08285 [Thalassiosira oceanica]|uniref:Uncharacterized protein n=1 Tax=Thalassiosira oceanica TaxID=159749 RepID=K0TAC4_THAOC|nr:hypothetical protein THAOC_08285 [Thalassiosira oceanica]|eukprot:EJK70361.1 hypothetical protein THAOC_08285 [Thalassiosira oceanica]
MALASALREKGLTLHGADFATIIVKFHAVTAVAIGLVYYWPKSSLSDAILSLVEKTGCRSVPHFVLAWIVVLWVHLALGYIFAVASTRKGGYNNKNPRGMEIEEGPVLRTKCAAMNMMESMAIYCSVLTIVGAAGSDLGEEANRSIAKWSCLVMIARTLYVGAYIADLDMIRTAMFGLGIFSCFAIS